MQKEYQIQQACNRIFDASPLAVNFVQKVSTHGKAAAASQGSRDQQWLPKQAATGLFKVGTSSRPPLLKAPGRPSVSYMDMFGKKANKSSDSSFGLVSKSDKTLSSKKQADVPPQTSNGTHVERKKLSDPYILIETMTAEHGRLPGRYGLRTRERSEVGDGSVNEAEAKPEKNIKSKPTTKSGPVESSLIKVTEQNEASQDDDDVDSLSNHSEVESERSSDEEEDIKSKPTTNNGPVESSFNKVTYQNDASQGDHNVDARSNHGIVESERSSEEEEDIQSNQTSESGVVKSSLNKVTEQDEASKDDDDVNTLSNQAEFESEGSSDEEEDNSKTTNLQSDTKKIDNGPVVKHQIKCAQSRTEPISKQETETVRNTSYTKSQPAKKDPEQRPKSLTILRFTEPVETPKTIRGNHSRAHRQRGSDSEVERSQLTKSTKGKTHDSLKRRVRGKGKNLNTSRNKKILDSLAQKGTEKDPLAFSDLPTTRSGRRVKPPLAWWAGQRVFVHPHDDHVEIKPPTPSNEKDALSASMIHFKEDVELERSKRCMSRKLLAEQQKSKTSLNKSDNLKKKSLMEGSCHQTCRRVKTNAHHQNSDKESGDESQPSLHSVSTPLSRSMPLYKSNGVFSEEDVLEKFDTPGFPKHLRNPSAARSRVGHFMARTLEVGGLEEDDLCRSFGSTPVSQLVKRRTAEDRKRLNTVTELEEETLLRNAHQRKPKPPTADCSEPKRRVGRPRKNVTKDTLSNKLTKTHEEKMAVQDHKTSKKRTRKRYASAVEYSDESDTQSVQEGHGRHLYKNEKQSNAASSQSSCSDESDEEVRKPKPPTADHSEPKRGRGRPRKNVTKDTISNKLTKTHEEKMAVQDHKTSKKRTKRYASPVEYNDESDTESVQEGHSRHLYKNEKQSNAASSESSCSDKSDEEVRKPKSPTADRSEPKRRQGRPRKNVTKDTISNKLTKTHEEKMAVQDHKTSKKRTRKRYASPVEYSDESDTESVQEGHGRHLYKNEKQSNAASSQSSCSDESDEEVRKPKPPTADRSEPKRRRGRPRKNVTKDTLSNKLTKTHEEKMAVQDHKTSKKRTMKRYASPVEYSDESDTESVQEGHGRHLYKNEKQSNAARSQSSCSDESDEEVIDRWSLKPLKHQRSNRRPNAGSQEENVKKTVNSKTNKKVASRVTEDESGSDGQWEPPNRQRGKVSSYNERKKAKATKAQPVVMISDDEGVDSIEEIEFTVHQHKTGRSQTKQEPNDGVKKSTTKSTSLKNVESKPLMKESKSRQGQAKKKVYPAGINREHEPQAPSKTKAKVFKDKENVKIRSSSDSVEDIWGSDEITLYKQSLRQLNPSMDNFWYHVHLLVETKTAQQCQAYHQRCAPLTVQKKKPAPPPKADQGRKPGLTGTAGTLKRKRELKTMIEELNHNHEDDFFDATPVRKAKRLKLPTQDDEDDDDFYQNRPNTETPLSARFTTPNPRLAWMPTSKTPVTSILSPSLTNTVDKKNTEVYVHRLITKRHKRLPAVGKIVEEQEPLHPATAKVAGGTVFQTLFKQDTPQEEDSEVEEDYYFSDSN